MNKDKHVPISVISRLPKYLRCVKTLVDSKIYRVSSRELSEMIGYTASQVRQDFNYFGEFGQQGYGYSVERLYKELTDIMDLKTNYNIAVIGAGNLGQALINYNGFEKYGFSIIAAFDANPKFFGYEINGIDVNNIENLPDFIQNNSIDIVILAIPKSRVLEVVNVIEKLEIRAIWNFTSVDIVAQNNMVIENVHMTDSLLNLKYKLKH